MEVNQPSIGIGWHSLPKEIQTVVISYLDDRSKRLARTADRELFKTINYSDFILKNTSDTTFSQVIDRLSQYTTLIGLTLPYNWPLGFTDVLQESARLTNLSKVTFCGRTRDLLPEEWLLLTALVNLQTADFMDAPAELYYHLTNLTAFRCEFENFEQAKRVVSSMSRLVSLSFYCGYSGDMLSIVPNPGLLTFLELQAITYATEFKNETIEKYSNIKSLSVRAEDTLDHFPFSKLTDLQDLTAVSPSGRYDIGRNTLLRSLSIGPRGSVPEHWNDEFTSLVNLDTISFCVSYSDTWYQFLTALTNLQHCTLGVNDAPVEKMTGELLSYFTSTRLTYLYCHTYQPFDARHLSGLTSLVELTLQEQRGRTPGAVEHGSLAPLTRLTQLRIQCAEGESLVGVPELTNLKVLVIENRDRHHRGEFPPEVSFSRLTRLEEFHLMQSDLPSIAADLQHMPHLTDLICSLPYIDTDEDPAAYSFLARAPIRLLTLHNQHCGEGFWSDLLQCTTLELLTVQMPDRSDRVTSLAALPHLTTLSVRHWQPMDVAHVTLLTSLHVLQLQSHCSTVVDRDELLLIMTHLTDLYVF